MHGSRGGLTVNFGVRNIEYRGPLYKIISFLILPIVPLDDRLRPSDPLGQPVTRVDSRAAAYPLLQHREVGENPDRLTGEQTNVDSGHK